MSIEFGPFKRGIFKKEIKNRFRALVELDNELVVCYIQSSSRLSNYMNLVNKEVLLKSNGSNNLKYTVFAVKKKYDFVLLCPKIANDVLYSELDRRIFSYLGYRKDKLHEFTIKGYKSDIYLENARTVIEVKAVLSEQDDVVFPIVYSERTIRQLDLFYNMIENGFKIVFIICALNPYIRTIILDRNSIFYKKILLLINKGLILKGYSITNKDDTSRIKKEIPIIF